MDTKTYGDLPSYPEIKELFKKHVDGPYYKIKAGNARTMIQALDGSYNDFGLFCLLVKLKVKAENGDEEAGQIASDILGTLGVEWV